MTYLVEIDRVPKTTADTLEEAQALGLALAEGKKSLKITLLAGPTPSSAHYWDYDLEDWVFNSNAGLVDERPRGG